jgi:hypothetical protein
LSLPLKAGRLLPLTYVHCGLDAVAKSTGGVDMDIIPDTVWLPQATEQAAASRRRLEMWHGKEPILMSYDDWVHKEQLYQQHIQDLGAEREAMMQRILHMAIDRHDILRNMRDMKKVEAEMEQKHLLEVAELRKNEERRKRELGILSGGLAQLQAHAASNVPRDVQPHFRDNVGNGVCDMQQPLPSILGVASGVTDHIQPPEINVNFEVTSSHNNIPPPEQSLPPGWIAHWDGITKRPDFVQLSPSISQWETPTHAVPIVGTPKPPGPDVILHPVQGTPVSPTISQNELNR